MTSSSFEFWIELAKEYKQEFGHLNIPTKVKDESFTYHGYPIGRWTNNVRTGHIQLSPEQREQLDEMGFVWDAYLAEWWDLFNPLKQWMAEHDGRWPRLVHDGDPEENRHARFTLKQRQRWKSGDLTPEQTEALLGLDSTRPPKKGVLVLG